MRIRTVLLAGGAVAAAAILILTAEPQAGPLPQRLPHLVRHPPPRRWFPSSERGGINPGREVQALHARGITGRGIGVAVIDQTPLATHREYADRLRWFDEIDAQSADPARWHGTATASLAVGRTVGAAPEADLYFVAIGANWSREQIAQDWLIGLRRVVHMRRQVPLALERILEMNRRLPREHRIRAVSIAVGWPPRWYGYGEMERLVQRARREGLFVSALDLAPRRMGPVRVASPEGDDKYSYFEVPAGSWWIAYTAGRFALEAEQNPAMTPEQFAAKLKAETSVR